MKVRIKILFRNGISKYYMLECNEGESIDAYCECVEESMLTKTPGSIELFDPIDNMNTIISLSEIVTFGYSIIDDKYYKN